jgi:protein AATF/BFR2
LTESLEISETLNRSFNPWRTQVLEKWSEKVKAASGLPIAKKFKALNQSITHQLTENLSDKDRLIDRTRTKRANFTVLGNQQMIDGKDIIDPEIFDDLDFYQPMLKDLVERKALDIPVDTWNRQTKVKKNVKDTRASKGRKLRYHEHEKIQNFMAPIQAGTWHDEQIE